jgi:spore maturation protein CgeB
LIRASKLVLADNPRPASRGYVSNRLFQSLAAGGALVMLQYFHDYQRLCLVDGTHVIIWENTEDLLEKIVYWLEPEHEDRRKAIAATGQRLCLEHHSFSVRVQELLEMVNRGTEMSYTQVHRN